MTYDIGSEGVLRQHGPRGRHLKDIRYMNKKLNTNGMRSRSNSDKLNKMMQKLASQMNQKDLRMDISEWLETCS